MSALISVTGAAGFVGSALCHFLTAKGRQVRPVVRSIAHQAGHSGSGYRAVSLERTDWSAAVSGVDTVIHLAARVPTMNDAGTNRLAQFQQANVDDTLGLAQQALAAGVRRFVFMSSIKVHGEMTVPGKGFCEGDTPNPGDAYGRSKWAAECGLREIALHSTMELVTVRAPLVYGPAVRANFALMMHAVAHQWPLPLGAVHNLRSLVAIDNLLDFIQLCATHPQAANKTFLVSDGQDLSTTELLRGLAHAMGVAPRLFAVPARLLVAMGTLLGHRAEVQRLCGNLQADISKARQVLAWSPPISVEEGLRRAVAGQMLR